MNFTSGYTSEELMTCQGCDNCIINPITIEDLYEEFKKQESEIKKLKEKIDEYEPIILEYKAKTHWDEQINNISKKN